MLRIPILITIILLLTHNGHTQYGFGTNTPNSNAVVHFTSSDSTKGVLLPVTTTAKLPIAANALKGMVVYNLDENCFQLCNGTNWKCLTINDSSEWVDGSLVGLTAGNIYARQSLTRGDTVTIDTNGKFGIGTNTPLQNLEVSGTGTVVAHVMTKDSTASDRAVFGIKRGTKLWDLGINTQLNNNNNLNFREGAIIRFTMAEGGNVGVGTNAPTFRLDVDSAINAGYHYYQKGERIVTAIPNNTAIASGNVAVGVNTLRNVSGILNTAVGNLTLDSNTTGNLNTAIGASSLRSNLTGSFNTGVGYNTLTSNSSGDDNTAMGRSALSQNTIGDSNTAVGVVSLGDNINGRLNVALGTGALANNISGNGNTSVGTDALRSSLNGNNNIAIGVDAGDNLSAGDNNIIIGSNIDFPSNTNSYQLNIGNIIYGTDIDGSGSTLSTGNIGIGTTTPSAKLDVENIVDGDTSEITTELNTYTTGATLTQNRSHTPLSITYTANNVVGAPFT